MCKRWKTQRWKDEFVELLPCLCLGEICVKDMCNDICKFYLKMRVNFTKRWKTKGWKDEFVELLPCLCLGELTVSGTQLSRPPVKNTMHCNDADDDDDEKDGEYADGDHNIHSDCADDIDFDGADNGVDVADCPAMSFVLLCWLNK